MNRVPDFVDCSTNNNYTRNMTITEKNYAINERVSFISTNLDCVPAGSKRILSDHLMFAWDRWESKVTSVSQSGEVPTHDMSRKGLNLNDPNDAIACCAEIYRLILIDYLHLAVAYFRGYKTVFRKSQNLKIQRMFTELNEVDTLREIFIQKELEKLIHGVNPPEKSPHL